MSRIDDAVRRVLRLKFRLGLFDHPNTLLKDYPLFGSRSMHLSHFMQLKNRKYC